MLVAGAAWAWVEFLILVWCMACGFDGATRPARRENPDGLLRAAEACPGRAGRFFTTEDIPMAKCY